MRGESRAMPGGSEPGPLGGVLDPPMEHVATRPQFTDSANYALYVYFSLATADWLDRRTADQGRMIHGQ
jgi:hypothetical protein